MIPRLFGLYVIVQIFFAPQFGLCNRLAAAYWRYCEKATH